MPATVLMGETPHVDVLMGIDCRRSASLGRAALSPVYGRFAAYHVGCDLDLHHGAELPESFGRARVVVKDLINFERIEFTSTVSVDGSPTRDSGVVSRTRCLQGCAHMPSGPATRQLGDGPTRHPSLVYPSGPRPLLSLDRYPSQEGWGTIELGARRSSLRPPEAAAVSE